MLLLKVCLRVKTALTGFGLKVKHLVVMVGIMVKGQGMQYVNQGPQKDRGNCVCVHA